MLAIMVALGCTVLLVANEVGRQVLPTAPYITLDVSCRTLWLVLVASYGRERCGCAFYVYKMLFAAANIAVLFVVQHKTEHEWASRCCGPCTTLSPPPQGLLPRMGNLAAGFHRAHVRRSR